MQPRPDPRILAALFRMLAPRLGAPEIGVFALRSDALRLTAGTERFAALWGGGAEAWTPLAPDLAAAFGAGRVARIDPRRIGSAAAFGAVLPIATTGQGGQPGLLMILDRRKRRLSPAMAAALRDGAVLLAPILGAAAPEPGQGTARGDVPARGAVLAPAAAHRLIDDARRGGDGRRNGALLVLDLDRFRAVNEVLGVAAGDAILAATATRLEPALGAGDRMLRLEGDRFVILSAQAGDALRTLAERLLAAVARPLRLGGRTVVTQASIGIVAAMPAELPTASVLRQADAALRRAKAEGRNRFALHEPRLDAAVLDETRLQLDLADALAHGQMHLVYQPYVDLARDEISGVEALLRWRHPTRGELQPAAFIPLAEATGLILPLGAWALRAALARAARWPAGLSLSVNISALQFHQPGFLAEVDAALAATGVPAERLELELTETVLMRDNPETVGQLKALIGRGVRIALDDFGTGYSALAYLARLPHHRIKLDRSFVQDSANPATAELIRAIIASARAQGIAVTAEGVERPALLEAVRRMGFTHAQGFATGAPLAEPAVLAPEPVVEPLDEPLV